jgi:hypothetical protein
MGQTAPVRSYTELAEVRSAHEQAAALKREHAGAAQTRESRIAAARQRLEDKKEARDFATVRSRFGAAVDGGALDEAVIRAQIDLDDVIDEPNRHRREQEYFDRHVLPGLCAGVVQSTLSGFRRAVLASDAKLLPLVEPLAEELARREALSAVMRCDLDHNRPELRAVDTSQVPACLDAPVTSAQLRLFLERLARG